MDFKHVIEQIHEQKYRNKYTKYIYSEIFVFLTKLIKKKKKKKFLECNGKLDSVMSIENCDFIEVWVIFSTRIHLWGLIFGGEMKVFWVVCSEFEWYLEHECVFVM